MGPQIGLVGCETFPVWVEKYFKFAIKINMAFIINGVMALYTHVIEGHEGVNTFKTNSRLIRRSEQEYSSRRF